MGTELLEPYHGNGGKRWSGRVRLVSGIQDLAAVGEHTLSGLSADTPPCLPQGPTERNSSELCLLAEGVEDVISGNEVG